MIPLVVVFLLLGGFALLAGIGALTAAYCWALAFLLLFVVMEIERAKRWRDLK